VKGFSNGSQRLNRILSLAGIASRRRADEMIEAGRVSVNGRIVSEPGARAIWGKDSIIVDGKEIPKPSERVYVMLHKPFGYICSLKDPGERPVVTDLIKDIPRRIYPVGRLDFDTLGLLLMTNDGDFAYRLTHPRYHVPKTYKATINGALSPNALENLRKGVMLEDGFSGRSRVTVVKQDKGRSVIRITVTQGRNRLIRRMLEALGYPATHLIRTGFGNLELGKLRSGHYRHLEHHEVMALKKSVGLPASRSY
jgi:23S rRNA pseudouridine2605 synthase